MTISSCGDWNMNRKIIWWPDCRLSQELQFFYPANNQQMFNSDCYLLLLIKSIKRRCNCQEKGKVMISTTSLRLSLHCRTDQLAVIDEGCQLIDLGVHSNSFENACSEFTGRGVYVLLLSECKL
jgi:hypothetical protein